MTYITHRNDRSMLPFSTGASVGTSGVPEMGRTAAPAISAADGMDEAAPGRCTTREAAAVA